MSETGRAASTNGAGPTETDVPIDVTMAELNELIRLYNESDWEGLQLDLRGIRLVLGRWGAPAAADATHAPATAPAPVPTALGVADTPAAVAPPAPDQAAPSAAEQSPSAPTLTEPVRAEPAPPAPAKAGHGRRIEVTAPVVGTFWVAPSPGEPPFVQVGDEVESGQQLAIVEVMKLMSEISSPVAGRVVDVCANNAELVEFEQVLFVIESDDG